MSNGKAENDFPALRKCPSSVAHAMPEAEDVPTEIDTPAFNVWLRAELRARHLTPAQFARLCQLPTVQPVLNGDQQPSYIFCARVAQVLGFSLADVQARARQGLVWRWS